MYINIILVENEKTFIEITFFFKYIITPLKKAEINQPLGCNVCEMQRKENLHSFVNRMCASCFKRDSQL